MGQTKIPADVALDHYIAVRSILQHILQDFEVSVGNASKWVSCRVNQTGVTAPKPFFLGWVENHALRTMRIAENKPDPGLYRFVDDVAADTYSDSLNDPTRVKRQDWKSVPSRKVSPPIKEELYLYLPAPRGHFQLGKDNETCRLSVAIKVDNRYVGTLNTGLCTDPGASLNDKLVQWGQSTTSELVQYLKNEFDLGGPVHP